MFLPPLLIPIEEYGLPLFHFLCLGSLVSHWPLKKAVNYLTLVRPLRKKGWAQKGWEGWFHAKVKDGYRTTCSFSKPALIPYTTVKVWAYCLDPVLWGPNVPTLSRTACALFQEQNHYISWVTKHHQVSRLPSGSKPDHLMLGLKALHVTLLGKVKLCQCLQDIFCYRKRLRD